MKKVAIVYHYLALYRLPIFHELMNSCAIEFHLFAGIDSEIRIKKIDSNLSSVGVAQGGLRWHILKNVWLFKKKFLWQKGLIKIALTSNFDTYIFLGSPYHISTWIASLIAKVRHRKVYYWMHGIHSEKLSLSDYLNLLLFYRIADGFFLYGNRAYGIMRRNKITKLKDFHIIYNSLDYESSLKHRMGIDVDGLRAFRSKYFKNQLLPTVVSIGRVNKTKRLDLLLRAQGIYYATSKHPIFNLLIIGDGDEMGSLKKLAEELDLNQYIHCFGASYDEETNAELLRYADLCVIPGEIGLTVIHALSYGTPVISHDNLDIQMPEIEAIKPGITGDLFKQNNIADLENKIKRWFINNPLKTEFLMQQCYSIVDQFYNPKFQAGVINTALNN